MQSQDSQISEETEDSLARSIIPYSISKEYTRYDIFYETNYYKVFRVRKNGETFAITAFDTNSNMRDDLARYLFISEAIHRVHQPNFNFQHDDFTGTMAFLTSNYSTLAELHDAQRINMITLIIDIFGEIDLYTKKKCANLNVWPINIFYNEDTQHFFLANQSQFLPISKGTNSKIGKTDNSKIIKTVNSVSYLKLQADQEVHRLKYNTQQSHIKGSYTEKNAHFSLGLILLELVGVNQEHWPHHSPNMNEDSLSSILKSMNIKDYNVILPTIIELLYKKGMMVDFFTQAAKDDNEEDLPSYDNQDKAIRKLENLLPGLRKIEKSNKLLQSISFKQEEASTDDEGFLSEPPFPKKLKLTPKKTALLI